MREMLDPWPPTPAGVPCIGPLRCGANPPTSLVYTLYSRCISLKNQRNGPADLSSLPPSHEVDRIE